MALTADQKLLHHEALERSRNFKEAEWQLILVLQKIDQAKLYKKLNCSSLFQYAVRELGFSESQSYAFIMVARKATEVKILASALEQQTLTVSKAIRIVSALNEKNSADLVAFATNHSSREIDIEVTKHNPRAKRKDRVKQVNEDQVEITLTVSMAAFKKFERVQALEAQRGKSADKGLAAEAAFDEYLYHRDPVEKAKRAKTKANLKVKGNNIDQASPQPQPANQLCSSKVFQSKRVKLTAEQKHEVFARDEGRCTHIDHRGNRCETNRWLHVHHIRPVSQGGGNEPENLTTLCSYHHDLVHQLSFPIEGQISWVRWLSNC